MRTQQPARQLRACPAQQAAHPSRLGPEVAAPTCPAPTASAGRRTGTGRTRAGSPSWASSPHTGPSSTWATWSGRRWRRAARQLASTTTPTRLPPPLLGAVLLSPCGTPGAHSGAVAKTSAGRPASSPSRSEPSSGARPRRRSPRPRRTRSTPRRRRRSSPSKPWRPRLRPRGGPPRGPPSSGPNLAAGEASPRLGARPSTRAGGGAASAARAPTRRTRPPPALASTRLPSWPWRRTPACRARCP
mmetsp:Transcript_12559/g.48234  ORF Transcript_12559/g.48234 Transcript_12559/m.48234 type:complete len:245 (+) Transcript_12559:847-1581(+)